MRSYWKWVLFRGDNWVLVFYCTVRLEGISAPMILRYSQRYSIKTQYFLWCNSIWKQSTFCSVNIVVRNVLKVWKKPMPNMTTSESMHWKRTKRYFLPKSARIYFPSISQEDCRWYFYNSNNKSVLEKKTSHRLIFHQFQSFGLPNIHSLVPLPSVSGPSKVLLIKLRGELYEIVQETLGPA